MLIEDLLVLPVGTRVFGRIDVSTTIPGVVASIGDGSHFIRWDDDHATIPLGNFREYDEYIAAHIQVDRGSRGARYDNAEDGNEAVTPGL